MVEAMIHKSHDRSSTPSREERLKASELQAINLVNVTFADALDYRKFRQHNHVFRYYKKMAARTTKLAKRMEKIMRP